MTPRIRLSFLIVGLVQVGMLIPTLARAQDEEPQGKTAKIKKAEWGKLIGEWSVDSALVAGKKLDANIAATMKLILEEGKYESHSGAVSKGKISLDPTTKPKSMDLTVDNENGESIQQIKCIYQLENEKLVVVYAFEGKRPEKFESTAENGLLMIEFKKSK